MEKKKFELIKNKGNNYFMVKVETLEDFKIFCKTRYNLDRDIELFWKSIHLCGEFEYCLTEKEFVEYYL